MRLPSSKRGPLEVSGHKLEGAPVSRITSFTSHAQLSRHRISTDLDWNTVLPREYDEGKKRKGIKNTYCCSVTQSCPTLCDPTDCSTPGFSVLHSLPELGQTHVHQVGDAIQSSHPLLSPSPAFNLSKHQGLYIKRISTMESKYGKVAGEDMKRLWETVRSGRTDGLLVLVMLEKSCVWDT